MEFHPQVFYKFFSNFSIENYYIGINTLTDTSTQLDSDLYYFLFDNFTKNLKKYDSIIGIVKIPLDVTIIEDENKFNSSQIYIEEFIDFKAFLETRCTEDLFLKAVTQDGLALYYIPEHLMTPKLCLAAINQTGYALQFVPEHLKTSELCLLAVIKNGIALKHVPKNLKTPGLCFLAVNGLNLDYEIVIEYVPEHLRIYEICLTSVKHNGFTLKFVPEKMKTSELCFLAVNDNGMNLEYVPEKLKTSEICHIAVNSRGSSILFVPKELRTLELCLLALKNDCFLIYRISEDPSFATAVKLYKDNLEAASE